MYSAKEYNSTRVKKKNIDWHTIASTVRNVLFSSPGQSNHSHDPTLMNPHLVKLLYMARTMSPWLYTLQSPLPPQITHTKSTNPIQHMYLNRTQTQLTKKPDRNTQRSGNSRRLFHTSNFPRHKYNRKTDTYMHSDNVIETAVEFLASCCAAQQQPPTSYTENAVRDKKKTIYGQVAILKLFSFFCLFFFLSFC